MWCVEQGGLRGTVRLRGGAGRTGGRTGRRAGRAGTGAGPGAAGRCRAAPSDRGAGVPRAGAWGAGGLRAGRGSGACGPGPQAVRPESYLMPAAAQAFLTSPVQIWLAL